MVRIPKVSMSKKINIVHPLSQNELHTYVVEVSTELVSDDSADIRQNLSLVLHEECVLNNQYLLKKKATIPETGDHAKFDT